MRPEPDPPERFTPADAAWFTRFVDEEMFIIRSERRAQSDK